MEVMGSRQSTVLARLHDAKSVGLDVNAYLVRVEFDGPDHYWRMEEPEWNRLNEDIAAARAQQNTQF